MLNVSSEINKELDIPLEEIEVESVAEEAGTTGETEVSEIEASEKEEKTYNVTIIRHSDLDGAGCCILTKTYLDKLATKLTSEGNPTKYVIKDIKANYDNVDAFVSQELLNLNMSADNLLLIEDISPSAEIMKELVERKDVYILDHHKTYIEKCEELSEPSNFRYPADEGFSATTYLPYLLDAIYQQGAKIGSWEELLENLLPFIELVTQYDTYQIRDADCLKLNKLYHTLGDEDFIIRCLSSKNPATFSSKEKYLLEQLLKKEATEVDKSVKTLTVVYPEENENNETVAITFDYKNVNAIAEYLRKAKYQDIFRTAYLVGIDMDRGILSFRSIKDTFDVSKEAKKFNGGGHAKAAGGFLDKAEIRNLLKRTVLNNKVVVREIKLEDKVS